jgi:hypothetical protein
MQHAKQFCKTALGSKINLCTSFFIYTDVFYTDDDMVKFETRCNNTYIKYKRKEMTVYRNYIYTVYNDNFYMATCFDSL